MSLYAIGDLHLSLGTDKPMDVFGGKWENYTEKLLEGFAPLTADDVTVICGDLSWAMSLEEAREDFLFIHRLPGKKIILKGNHDYWWTTASAAYRAFAAWGIDSISILNNNCHFYGGTALCGTRGWFYEEEHGAEHDKKIMLREIGRLEMSLKCAGEAEKLVFLHYPPRYQGYECTELIDLMEAYKVPLCVYGHIHSKGCAAAFNGVYRGTRYRLVSADYADFAPVKILD